MSCGRVAVIDVGSNSIKLLVVESGKNDWHILADETVEARISQGMYLGKGALQEQPMDNAIRAIKFLQHKASICQPDKVILVATSAVRDAKNQRDFIDKVKRETGLIVEVLSGSQEAKYIASGLRQEPALKEGKEFASVDLGGGSLELVFSTSRKDARLYSLDLGAVRMRETFCKDTTLPIGPEEKLSIRNYCKKIFEATVPQALVRECWGTGGVFTIARLILATKQGYGLRQANPVLSVETLSVMEAELSSQSLAERILTPGLPKSRADIFPLGLLILLSLAEYLKIDSFHHSFCNLRMGVAVSSIKEGI